MARSGRLDVGEKAAHLAVEALGFPGERIGQRLDVDGGCAGVVSGAGDTVHGLGAGARFTRGAVDAFGDNGDRLVLLLDGDCNGRGNR